MMPHLAIVEAFHLGFLRALARALPPTAYALKGGANLRFFFGSIRYSEDIGLDVDGPPVFELRDKVGHILSSAGLRASLRPLGVDAIDPPNLSRAKQTETVQRFKAHLITTAGEDLATKIEFSRRGMDAPIRAEPVRSEVLRPYRMPPLLVSHYTAIAAARQKLRALAGRTKPQARDVFDLHVLSAQLDPDHDDIRTGLPHAAVEKAIERVYDIEYEDYRDQVVGFLSADESTQYDSLSVWDEIRLIVVALIEGRPSRA